MRKTYTFDASEFHVEEPRKAICTAEEKDGEWHCDIKLDLDPAEISKTDMKTISMTLRERFEADLYDDYRAKNFLWKGDRKSPLLRLQKGDKVSFKGGQGEIVYVVPERNYGVKTADGKVLNFSFKSLEHFLFKKL